MVWFFIPDRESRDQGTRIGLDPGHRDANNIQEELQSPWNYKTFAPSVSPATASAEW